MMKPKKNDRNRTILTTILIVVMLILTAIGAYALIGDFEQGDPTSDRIYEWGQYGRDITGSNNNLISTVGEIPLTYVESNVFATQKEPIVGDFDVDWRTELFYYADGYLNVLNATLRVRDQYILGGGDLGQPSMLKANWYEYGNRNYFVMHNNTNFMVFAFDDEQIDLIYNEPLYMLGAYNAYGSGITCWNNDDTEIDGCIFKGWEYSSNDGLGYACLQSAVSDGVAESDTGILGGSSSNMTINLGILVYGSDINDTFVGDTLQMTCRANNNPGNRDYHYSWYACETDTTIMGGHDELSLYCTDEPVKIIDNYDISSWGNSDVFTNRNITFDEDFLFDSAKNYIIYNDFESGIINTSDDYYRCQQDDNGVAINKASLVNSGGTVTNQSVEYRFRFYGRILADELDTDLSLRTSAGYFLFTKVETNANISDPLGTNLTFVSLPELNHDYTDISEAAWNETFSVEDWDTDNNMEFVAVIDLDDDNNTVDMAVYDILLANQERTFTISRNVGGTTENYCRYNDDRSEMNPIFHQFGGGDWEVVKLCPGKPGNTFQIPNALWGFNSAGATLTGYPVQIVYNMTGGSMTHPCGGYAQKSCVRAGYGIARNFDNGKIVVSYRAAEINLNPDSRTTTNQQGIVEVDAVGNKDYVVGPCEPSSATGNLADRSEMAFDWCYGKNTWNQLTMARADFDTQVDYIVGDLIFSDNESLVMWALFRLGGDPHSTNPYVYDAKTIVVDLDGDDRVDYFRSGRSFSGTEHTHIALTSALNELPELTNIVPDTCYPVCIDTTVQYQGFYEDREGNTVYTQITCNEDEEDDFETGNFEPRADGSDIVGNCTYDTIGTHRTTIWYTDSAHLGDTELGTQFDVIVQIGNCYNTGESDQFCQLGIGQLGNLTDYDEYGINTTGDDEGSTLTSQYFDWSQCDWTGLGDIFEPICPLWIWTKQGALGMFDWIFSPLGFAILLVLVLVALMIGIVFHRKK